MKLIKFICNREQITIANTTDESLAEYKNVFVGIGKMPGKCNNHLKPGVTPFAQPLRREPLALQDRLRKELEQLVCC